MSLRLLVMEHHMAVYSRLNLAWLALAACTTLAVACGDDATPGDGDGSSDGSDDGSGSDDPACNGLVVPVDGDSCDCEGVEGSGVEAGCDRLCSCTAGFWDCETLGCDDPDAPGLSWADLPSVEETEGNGDDDANPGETFALRGTLLLERADDGVTVVIQASTSSARIELEEPSLEFEGAVDGEITFEFVLNIADDAAAGEVSVTLDAYVVGQPDIVNEDVAVEITVPDSPSLAFDGLELTEGSGDGNRFVDAGERWVLTATLQNNGTLAAEDVEVTATPSNADLALDEDTVSVGILGDGGTREVSFEFTVAANPTELDPQIQLAATSSNAATTTEIQTVTIVPTETLSAGTPVVQQVDGEGNDDAFADVDEVWEVVVPVTNNGTFEVPGLEWRLNNYVSPSPDEEPYFPASLGFALTDEPVRLAAGASGSVTAQTTITAETPSTGRVILTATSDLRRHGPFALTLTLPLPR
jgi:hypothetical protein